MTTASDEMRECLLDALPKSQHKKIDAIMERFDTLLNDVATQNTVWVDGSRPAIETVKIYGLEIGVDACGNAEWVSSATVGHPQGLTLGELIYSK